jgi:tRNA(Ile)-lysidine synthase
MAGTKDDDGAPDAPLDNAAFAALMARFAPFEAAPHLAVAVSGGADSLALALLAHDWARARGGDVTALTVDHRLRPEGTAEATQVGAWLGLRAIAQRTLVREGPPLAGDIQAAARAARYRLFEDWCAAAGVLHLLTAHHREDQAETLLLRLARGSGLDGLAAMPAVIERASCRVLRPLIDVPRARLRATLEAAGQDWIEDPSNRDGAYARVRLRKAAAFLAEEGLSSRRLAETAARLGRARRALEGEVARLLARAAWLHPAGFAWLDPAALAGAPDEVALRALAALVACVGGSPYPPRLDGTERLLAELRQGLAAGRTLGGCRVLPRRGRVLLCREAEAVAAPVAAAPGARVHWDGRFVLRLPAAAPADLRLGALGAADEIEAPLGTPAVARPALPCLRDGDGIAVAGARLRFRPLRPLSGGGHGFF